MPEEKIAQKTGMPLVEVQKLSRLDPDFHRDG
jgi:cytidylate kinase